MVTFKRWMELRMKNVSSMGVHRKIQLLGVAGGWNLGAGGSQKTNIEGAFI